MMKRLIHLAPLMALILFVVASVTAISLTAPVHANAASGEPFEYVDASGDTQPTNDLSKAIAGALRGTRVIKLTEDADYIISGNNEYIATISGSLEIDLDGHTLNIYQNGRQYLNISGGANLTIKNGTMCVKRYDTGNEGISYPIFYFRNGKSGGVLNLEDVNTYSGTLIFSSSATDATVNVIGGEHHTTHHKILGYEPEYSDGGFVNSRTPMTFTASGATFFTDKSSLVVASTSAATASTYTFTDCKLISDPKDNDGTYTLVKSESTDTTFTFNDCDIYGSVYADRVVLGNGTRICDSMTVTGYTTTGGTLNPSPSTETFTVMGCADDVSNGFTFAKQDVICPFTHEVGEVIATCAVSWHDENGSLICTENVTRGATATPPEHTIPEKIRNGWVDITFDGGWAHTLYGQAADLTVTEDTSFYPSASVCRSRLDSLMHNLTLFGNVSLNVFLPLEDAPEGIELLGLTNADSEEFTPSDSLFAQGGVRYTWYIIGSVGAIELGTELEVNARFLYNGIEFTQTFMLSPAKYAETVLSSTAFGDAKQMIADMVIYSNSIWQFVNKTDSNDPALDALITAYLDLATPKDDVTSESFTQGARGEYASLYPYVTSLTFDVAAYEPCYLLKFDSSACVKGVRFVAASGAVYATNTDTAEYDENGYLLTARSLGMSLYFIDSRVEIILTVDDGGTDHEVRGAYTLNDYYNGVHPRLNAESPEDATRLDSLMRSLRAYAASALAYKNR